MGHGLLTGYTAQALPSMMRADSRIQMTETHKTWISNYYFLLLSLKNHLKKTYLIDRICFLNISVLFKGSIVPLVAMLSAPISSPLSHTVRKTK